MDYGCFDQFQTGPSPPVIMRPKGEGHAIGRSRMNLFADLANAGVTVDGEEGGGEGEEAMEKKGAPTVVGQQKLAFSLKCLIALLFLLCHRRTSFHSVKHNKPA